MERFYRMARGANRRFPGGNEPFQIVTRLLEECGEIAAEVNLWEGSGRKCEKHGAPQKENLANEIRQAMVALTQLALYYGVEEQLETQIEANIARKGWNEIAVCAG